MILPDANLLIYAVDADSPHQARARTWLEEVLSGSAAVGFAWPVLLAFLRLTTRSAVFSRPLSVEQACCFVDGWLATPVARLVLPGSRHWLVLRELLTATGTAGNLSSDAHLAALALEHGARIASADGDFRRFPGVHWFDPLAK
ncbi:MAG: type II toxin-antitoxin system VapC family toxin [Thermoanaerobaculia bacterium]